MMPPYMDGGIYRMKPKQYIWTKLDHWLNDNCHFTIGKWSLLGWKLILQCKLRGHMPMVMYPRTPKDDYLYRVFCSCCGVELLKQIHKQPFRHGVEQ